MQAAALAQAIIGSRRSDGTVSLQDLKNRLSLDGLHELAQAVGSLAQGEKAVKDQRTDPEVPWV